MPNESLQSSPLPLKKVADKATKNQLGTINGVFVPCLLNILGTILFLRIGFSVGQVGLIGTVAVFLLGEVIAVLTVLSISALASNGRMSGGGSYYLISRSLGPAFGGSVGVLFYISYAVGIAFYVVSFAGAVATTAGYNADAKLSFSGPVDAWVVLAIGTGSLALLLVVACIGAGCFAKVNVMIFVGLFATIMYSITFLYASGEKLQQHCDPNDTDGGADASLSSIQSHAELLVNVGGAALTSAVSNVTSSSCMHHRPTIATLKTNLYPALDHRPQCAGGQVGDMCTWHQLFSIVFPAVTGIMEGANLSGDLKNPAASIGAGTLSAIALSLVVYGALMVAIASTLDRHSLKSNMAVLQDSVGWWWVVLLGIGAATLSSALGALFGGARVLQAIARDELFPKFFSFIGYGSTRGDEPRVAVIITWVIAQSCLFLGTLDAIAPLITNFFLTSYGFTNLACFLLDTVGTPNYRPSFKYYSRTTSFLGFVLSFVVMFYLSWDFALATLILMAVIFAYIAATHTPKWDDVSQALIYHQVRKYLLNMRRSETVLSAVPNGPAENAASEEEELLSVLDEEEGGEAALFGRKPGKFAEAKFWRPQVMLILRSPRCATMHFCNTLKKGGLFVVATPFVAKDIRALQSGVAKRVSAFSDWNLESVVSSAKTNWFLLIDAMKMKAFVNVMVAASWNSAIQNLVIGTGLGAMAPNMVVIAFDDLNYPATTTAAPQIDGGGDGADDSEVPGSGHHRRGSTWSHPASLNESLESLAAEKIPGATQTDDGSSLAAKLPNVFSLSDAVGTIRDVLWLRKAIVITRWMERLPSEMREKETFGLKMSRSWNRSTQSCCSKFRRTSAVHSTDSHHKKKYIDLWHVFPENALSDTVELDPQLALRLQLAYIVAEQWGLALRLFYVCTEERREALLKKVDALAYSTRIQFTAVIAQVVDDINSLLPDQLGACIASASGRCTPCAMVFLALPSPPTAGAVADAEADATYMRDLDSLSAVADMPALAFIRAATDRVVVTTEI